MHRCVCLSSFELPDGLVYAGWVVPAAIFSSRRNRREDLGVWREFERRELELEMGNLVVRMSYAPEVVSGRRKRKVPRREVAPDLVTLFSEWLATLDAELAPPTVQHYEMYVGVHFLSFFDSLEDITKATGTEYFQARLRKVTRRTVLKELLALRRFLGWCEDHEFIEAAPIIKSPSQKATGTRRMKHKSIHLSKENIERVIAAPRRAAKQFNSVAVVAVGRRLLD